MSLGLEQKRKLVEDQNLYIIRIYKAKLYSTICSKFSNLIGQILQQATYFEDLQSIKELRELYKVIRGMYSKGQQLMQKYQKNQKQHNIDLQTSQLYQSQMSNFFNLLSIDYNIQKQYLTQSQYKFDIWIDKLYKLKRDESLEKAITDLETLMLNHVKKLFSQNTKKLEVFQVIFQLTQQQTFFPMTK